jgi:hypothetical protein
MADVQTKALIRLVKNMKDIKEQLKYLEESMDILVKLELERNGKTKS